MKHFLYLIRFDYVEDFDAIDLACCKNCVNFKTHTLCKTPIISLFYY